MDYSNYIGLYFRVKKVREVSKISFYQGKPIFLHDILLSLRLTCSEIQNYQINVISSLILQESQEKKM